VNLEKTFRQLRKEATANPKKAAILGLLGLVALYFWAPLLWTWLGDEAPAGPGTAQASLVGFDPLALAGPSAAAKEEPKKPDAAKKKIPWDQLAAWMKDDPRTAAATALTQRPDPFRVQVEEEPEPEEEPEQQIQPPPVAPEVTPESLGIGLSATVVGPRRRVAVIAGRAFAEGETVAMEKDGETYEFRLAEVRPRTAVLQREGKQFELVIPQKSRLERIQLSGSSN
jgi:hypothetical protein